MAGPFNSQVHQMPSGFDLITQGLENRWVMDDGSGAIVADSIGAKDATIQNFDPRLWETDPERGMCLRIDSPGGGLIGAQTLDSPSFQARQFSTSVFVKPATSGGGASRYRHSPVLRGWGFYFQDNTHIRSIWRHTTGNHWYGAVNKPDLLGGSFFHLYFGYPYDGSIPVCYIDAVQQSFINISQAGNALNGITDPPDDDWWMGVCTLPSGSADPVWSEGDCLWSDFRIYDRLLTPAELQQISNNQG